MALFVGREKERDEFRQLLRKRNASQETFEDPEVVEVCRGVFRKTAGSKGG